MASLEVTKYVYNNLTKVMFFRKYLEKNQLEGGPYCLQPKVFVAFMAEIPKNNLLKIFAKRYAEGQFSSRTDDTGSPVNAPVKEGRRMLFRSKQ